jgi:hypothetical protein
MQTQLMQKAVWVCLIKQRKGLDKERLQLICFKTTPPPSSFSSSLPSVIYYRQSMNSPPE